MNKKHHTPAKITLARYGGIGKLVKQKNNYVAGNEEIYHNAPERKGYYAFIFPYIELFLLGSPVNASKNDWDENRSNRGRFVEKKAHVYKKFFATGGTIWTHMMPKKRHMILEEKGGWVKINVSDFSVVLGHYLSDLGRSARSSHGYSLEVAKQPFRIYSKDDMEVFITRDTKINS